MFVDKTLPGNHREYDCHALWALEKVVEKPYPAALKGYASRTYTRRAEVWSDHGLPVIDEERPILMVRSNCTGFCTDCSGLLAVARWK